MADDETPTPFSWVNGRVAVLLTGSVPEVACIARILGEGGDIPRIPQYRQP